MADPNIVKQLEDKLLLLKAEEKTEKMGWGEKIYHEVTPLMDMIILERKKTLLMLIIIVINCFLTLGIVTWILIG